MTDKNTDYNETYWDDVDGVTIALFVTVVVLIMALIFAIATAA